ncbi:MAG: alpha/beta hydrolase-fold protein [Betaproteobacteria bacterium]|jgi:predicted alpha/beta superfamily hydrolase
MAIDNTWAVLANTEVHYLSSSTVGDEFKIFVAHPMAALPQGKKAPVVYVLDANSNFGLVSDIVRGAALAGLPHAFVVGIGYRSDGMMQEAFLKRSRDYTPTAMPEFDRSGATLAGLPDERISTGGAAAFIRFIQDELEPFIEGLYPVDDKDRTLIGMSLGGLFASWVLLSQPEAFERYLICSPSLWWDNDHLMRQPAIWPGRSHVHARVFLAAGDLERDEQVRARVDAAPEAVRPLLQAFRNAQGQHLLAEHVEELTRRLVALQMPGLQVTSKVFPDEAHESVYPSALARGVGALFSPLATGPEVA